MLDYSLANAQMVGRKILSLCTGLSEAVQDARSYVSINGGPILVYIPAKFNSAVFSVELSSPSFVPLINDTRGQKDPIYGSLELALEGRNVRGELHKSFLLLDPSKDVVLDFIDRSGKSVFPFIARREYYEALRRDVPSIALYERIYNENIGVIESQKDQSEVC
ncbi:hypothetical protein HYW75_00770 [Candidatus Pacearchaeota archaeon]|nr:hypothetical protein [Candidatus Pacearchaeota archaeon]